MRSFAKCVFVSRMMFTKVLRSATAVALSVGLTASVPASARKKAPSASPKMSAAEECVKQQGGSYDPVRKKWLIHDYSEMGGTAKADALRECVSRKTGAPRSQISVPTYYIDRPGVNY
jgi:hypothetical protein